VGIAAGYRHSLCITSGKAKKVRDLKEYQEYFEILRQEGLLVYDVLKKNMEERGLNPDYLDTPNLVLPGQPGLENKPCEFDGAEPGMQYCIDTIKNPDENLVIMNLRGTYETTYKCIRCCFEHVCMACARHCHAQHAVVVQFKLRKYNDICVCCATDICNVRWNIIRHEFDKLALKNEDRCVALEDVQDLLEVLTLDIESRRGGLPLTSKQKEDDLRTAHDALVVTNGVKYDSDSYSDDGGDGKENDSKDKAAAAGGGIDAVRKKGEEKKKIAGQGDSGKKNIEEEFDVLKTRVGFKLFEKWYLGYFVVDEIEDA